MTKLMFGKLAATILQGVGSADSYALGKPPTPPAEFALPQPRGGWGMLGNDTAGDCLAEGTLVQAQGATGGLRAAYSGPVVRLAFESGRHLTVTPDHAILTPAGFVPARLLHEGDYAVSARGGEVGNLRLQKDLYESPAPVEDVLASLLRSGPGARERRQGSAVVSPVDLNGYEAFLKGNVDVVRADGLLQGKIGQPVLSQPYRHEQISSTSQLERSFHRRRPPFQGPVVGALASLRSVSASGYGPSTLVAHGGIPQGLDFGLASAGYASFVQEGREPVLAHLRLLSQRLSRLTSHVAIKERLHLRVAFTPPQRSGFAGAADQIASSGKPTADGGPTDPQLAGNLRKRHPGLIEEDRLVEVNWEWFTGHIYDLSTPAHWYLSNGIVTHNCTIAGAAHLIEAVESQLPFVHQVEFTTDQAIRQYSEITGYDPATGQNDTGCNENAVLELWRTKGLFTGHRIAAHAPVPINDVLAVHRAIAFYGGCYIGIACPQSAQQQFQDGKPWTVVPGSPIAGGHCIVPVAYDPEGIDCVTWGGIARVTWPWWVTYVDEVHCVITDSEVQARMGVGAHPLDLSALRADLDRLA